MTGRVIVPDTPWRPLLPVEIQLLEQKLRKETAEAAKAEIELAATQDAERDRLQKTGRIRHLYINDVVSGMKADAWIDALQHWGRRDPGLPITIDINSPGGSVTEGLAIYDTIQRLRREGTHVTTRALGYAASMGAILLQAGDVRVMDARAKLMLHEGSILLQGSLTPGEQEDLRTWQDMLRNDLLDIMSERSTLTKRQIQTKWKRKDWWIAAPEALKLGFVDVVG